MSLDNFEIRDATVAWIMSVLTTPVELGSAKGRLLDGILLLLTLWGSLQIARLIRFVLDEEVFPPPCRSPEEFRSRSPGA